MVRIRVSRYKPSRFQDQGDILARMVGIRKHYWGSSHLKVPHCFSNFCGNYFGLCSVGIAIVSDTLLMQMVALLEIIPSGILL